MAYTMSISLDQGLPEASSAQVYVSVHALSAGSLTLPEWQFVQPAEKAQRRTVPSLSFLIKHYDGSTGECSHVVFDLGLRRILDQYPSALQKHLLTRTPLSTEPDVKASLEAGGLLPRDIDLVILSHAHWDHVGTPSDFQDAHFLVGPGTLRLLQHGPDASSMGASHSHFESDLLPPHRTIELPDPKISNTSRRYKSTASLHESLSGAQWRPLAHFPHAIDVYADGSLFIINAPGHLQGHINLLARCGPRRWIYLGGDACHDRRILTGERDIAQWSDNEGKLCCIHQDKAETLKTLARIRRLEEITDNDIEIIFAHDLEWMAVEDNQYRFWPRSL